jgi:hypothetical protein
MSDLFPWVQESDEPGVEENPTHNERRVDFNYENHIDDPNVGDEFFRLKNQTPSVVKYDPEDTEEVEMYKIRQKRLPPCQ